MVICLILRLAPTLNETRIAEAEAEQDSAYVQGQFRLKKLASCLFQAGTSSWLRFFKDFVTADCYVNMGPVKTASQLIADLANNDLGEEDENEVSMFSQDCILWK